MSDDARAAPPPAAPARCSHCGRVLARDEPSIVLMRAGEIVAIYHERCRPDRRRSGCDAC